MEIEQKKKLIKYLTESYQTAQITGESANHLEIDYNGKNFTFSMEISGKQYFLTRNQLADKPDGVGDELAGKIMTWVK